MAKKVQRYRILYETPGGCLCWLYGKAGQPSLYSSKRRACQAMVRIKRSGTLPKGGVLRMVDCVKQQWGTAI